MRGFKNTRPALFAGPPTRPPTKLRALATVRRIRSRSRNLLSSLDLLLGVYLLPSSSPFYVSFFSSTCFFLSHFFLPFLSHLSRLLLLLLLVSLLLVVLVLLLLLLEKKKKRRKVCSFSGFLFSSKRARTFFCNRKRSVEGARRELRNLWESSK